MSKEPRYAWIGAFVVGAALLLVSAVAFFGRGRFFEDNATFITYFSGSVKGLTEGAPVSFRGARVGTVKDVSIVYKQSQDQLLIPVLIELDRDSVKGLSDVAPQAEDHKTRRLSLVERMIAKGLRAQLALESIVTGQLFVQLDFMPTVPALYHPDYSDGYAEIPTAPSSFEKVQATLQELPLTELANKTVSSVSKLEALLTAAQDDGMVRNFSSMLLDVRQLADQLKQVSTLLSEEIKQLSVRSGEATSQATQTLKDLDLLLLRAVPMVQQGAATLDELSNTARTVRRLADYLERNPEALLRAKE
jgi:paraquat-inducible protein B